MLDVSSYPKLRLDKDWVSGQLIEAGLRVIRNEVAQGMAIIVAKKD